MAFLSINNRDSLRYSDDESKRTYNAISGLLGLFLSEKIISIEIGVAEWPKKAAGFSLETERLDNLTVLCKSELPTKEFFHGVIKLASYLQNSNSHNVAKIKPYLSKSIIPHHTKFIEITCLSGRKEGLWIGHDTAAFPDFNLGPESHANLNFEVALKLSFVCHSLEKLDEEYTTNEYLFSAVSNTFNCHLAGKLNEMGNLLLSEVNMDNRESSPEIRAQVLLGTISLPLSELLALRPGSEIEIDWPESAKGSLSFDGKEWAQVEIKATPGKISLKLPKEATFPRTMRFPI